MPHRARVLAITLLAGMLTIGAGLASCASHETTTVRTQTVEEPGPATDAQEGRQPATRTDTTTTTDRDERSPGIVGSAFRLVWAVISFPFRVIADLF